jgi:AhpD family alkylhydroperoxidase
MSQRLDYRVASPKGVAAMLELESHIRHSGLEEGLLDLFKTRASQINGCAYCLDMHTKDAQAGGETEQRLYALSAWRETPLFTERERSALAWTEAVTRISDGPITDAIYNSACEYLGEKEMVDLTLAVIAINGWNRLAISFQAVPGSYQLPRR